MIYFTGNPKFRIPPLSFTTGEKVKHAYVWTLKARMIA